MIRRWGLLAFLGLWAAVPAAAQLGPAEALAQDAAEFARVSGLTSEQAAIQLRAQADTRAVTDALRVEFRDRLAGISVRHRPGFGIDVLLTGDAPVAPRWATGGGVAVPIIFRTGAPATRDQLLAALTQHQAAIRAMLPRPPGLAVDPRTGTLALVVSTADAANYAPGELESEISALTGVPVSLRLIDGVETDSGAIEGGARVLGTGEDGRRYLCTSGFVVTDGARDGLVTAAHCADQADYVAPDGSRLPLSFVGQWGWSHQDVQLHLAESALSPAFYADTAKTALRPVVAVQPRAATRAGDVVCHRGERTGYSCAQVEFVDFAPAGDLCGGPCAPTWVSVAGPGCRAGDSGGPVFLGTTALGIMKGGSYRADRSCAFWFYMSTDYLPDGWRVALGTVPERPGAEDGGAPGR
jgi:streptogrisin C